VNQCFCDFQKHFLFLIFLLTAARFFSILAKIPREQAAPKEQKTCRVAEKAKLHMVVF
jgi:hypothetical protein